MRDYVRLVQLVWAACAVPGDLGLDANPAGTRLTLEVNAMTRSGSKVYRYRSVDLTADRLLVVRNLATETVLLADTVRRELVLTVALGFLTVKGLKEPKP